MGESDSEDELLLLHLLHRRNTKRKKRRIWVHDLLQRREEFGEFHRLVKELSSHEDKFYQYFRMSEPQFLHLLQMVDGDLQKTTTYYRRPISSKERLAIGLRYLATGDSYKTISFSYRVGKSTTVSIVPEVCQALWNKLQPIYMPAPKQYDWNQIADGFLQRWQFSNCVGAVDGKHVLIQAPPNSGSAFFNYKRTFSIVLMAVVDYMYCFTVIDVGAYGSNSDGGIFGKSSLGKALLANTLDLPEDKPLPGALEMGTFPHFLVEDEAFPMKRNLMRPYPGHDLDDNKRIFNYRLSRARRIVENAFGILAARFRVYQRRVQLHPQNVDKVIKATCVLHNFLQKTSPSSPGMGQVHGDATGRPSADAVDDRGAMLNLQPRGNRAAQEALNVRDRLKDYFNSQEGSVVWQRDMCFGQAN